MDTPRRRGPRAPGGVVECGWCGQSIPVPARGRVPTWCSSSCRHRAWEQRRAAASGLCAVEVVDREIEIITVETVIKPELVAVHVEQRSQSATEFAQLLVDLAHRLDTGRIYDETSLASTPPSPHCSTHSFAGGSADRRPGERLDQGDDGSEEHASRPSRSDDFYARPENQDPAGPPAGARPG